MAAGPPGSTLITFIRVNRAAAARLLYVPMIVGGTPTKQIAATEMESVNWRSRLEMSTDF
jgi:hypothetical protein